MASGASATTATLIKVVAVGKMSSDTTTWDEKGRSKITTIFISHNDEGITCLQFLYDEGGKSVLSKELGQNTGSSKFSTVTFDAANEYITRVGGTYTNFGIKSLKIETNQSKYGPFGPLDKYDDEFSFDIGPSNRFGGFHGSSSSRRYDLGLAALGVYVKSTPTG